MGGASTEVNSQINHQGREEKMEPSDDITQAVSQAGREIENDIRRHKNTHTHVHIRTHAHARTPSHTLLLNKLITA